MTPSDDRSLLAALKENDRSAINLIFLTYHALLCRVSFRIVNDREEAKDVVQDVFVKLWRNRMEINISHSLEAYLKRAVINTSLNHVERKNRFISFDPNQAAFNHGSENVVDRQHSFNELSSRIDEAINNLPLRTKAVFTLIRFEEMTYKEVSESLDISLKAVEKEMMKALKLLREALKDYLLLLIATLCATL